jgi:hypothetical protein
MEELIYLAEFCECGSLMIDGRCTNKNCVHRGDVKTEAKSKRASSRTKSAAKGTDTEKNTAKCSNPRRASKCITYNLYEEGIRE